MGRYLERQIGYDGDEDDRPPPQHFSERYVSWSTKKQCLVWLAAAIVLALIAVGISYAIPLLFAIKALTLLQLVCVGSITALGVSTLALLFDSMFVKRPAWLQFFKTVFMGMLGLGLCVVGALLHAPSSLLTLPSMLLKFSPKVAAWSAPGQMAALMGIIFAYILAMAAVSYALVRLSAYCERKNLGRMARFLHGSSWGFSLGVAAVPLIFIAKFIAVGHLVSFLSSTALGAYGAGVFALALPVFLGLLAGVINGCWHIAIEDDGVHMGARFETPVRAHVAYGNFPEKSDLTLEYSDDAGNEIKKGSQRENPASRSAGVSSDPREGEDQPAWLAEGVP